MVVVVVVVVVLVVVVVVVAVVVEELQTQALQLRWTYLRDDALVSFRIYRMIPKGIPETISTGENPQPFTRSHKQVPRASVHTLGFRSPDLL